jgi:ketosteroid isomerase-like protein
MLAGSTHGTLSPTAATSAAREAAAEWVARFEDGWAAPASAAAFCAHFSPILDPSIRLLQPQMPATTGLEAFERDFAGPLFELMPDVHATVEHWASLDETIFIELTISGTLRGGRHLSWRACDRVVLRDGRALERESYFDPSPILAALARSPRAWPAFVRVRLGRTLRGSNRHKETR